MAMGSFIGKMEAFIEEIFIKGKSMGRAFYLKSISFLIRKKNGSFMKENFSMTKDKETVKLNGPMETII